MMDMGKFHLIMIKDRPHRMTQMKDLPKQTVHVKKTVQTNLTYRIHGFLFHLKLNWYFIRIIICILYIFKFIKQTCFSPRLQRYRQLSRKQLGLYQHKDLKWRYLLKPNKPTTHFSIF